MEEAFEACAFVLMLHQRRIW